MWEFDYVCVMWSSFLSYCFIKTLNEQAMGRLSLRGLDKLRKTWYIAHDNENGSEEEQ